MPGFAVVVEKNRKWGIESNLITLPMALYHAHECHGLAVKSHEAYRVDGKDIDCGEVASYAEYPVIPEFFNFTSGICPVCGDMAESRFIPVKNYPFRTCSECGEPWPYQGPEIKGPRDSTWDMTSHQFRNELEKMGDKLEVAWFRVFGVWPVDLAIEANQRVKRTPADLPEDFVDDRGEGFAHAIPRREDIILVWSAGPCTFVRTESGNDWTVRITDSQTIFI